MHPPFKAFVIPLLALLGVCPLNADRSADSSALELAQPSSHGASFVNAAAADASGSTYVVDWFDESGKRVRVAVIPDQDCPAYKGRGCAYTANVDQGYAAIYLGRNERRLTHELAHVAGMRHGAWRRNTFGTECAVVTVGGFQTGYSAGDVICSGFDGSDIVERSKGA